MTGVTALANAVGAKRLQLLREIVPQSTTSGLLVNPTNQNAEPDVKDAQTAADTIGQTLVVVKATTDAEIDTAFDILKQRGVGGLVVNPDPFLLGRRDRIAKLAERNRIATIFHTHEPVVAGGLISYGASFPEAHRQAGRYVARVLKGEKPPDLPVPLANTFETVINLKTARSLGLTIPPALLATADEVIE
jgi:putative ABC transport system substrate-binding protein